MNIITSGTPGLCDYLKNEDNIIYEHNFEQIIALAKSGELKKLCIFMDVWNCYGRSFNQMRGQGAAEKIHEINPNISILIWEGREYDPDDPDILIPPAFQVSGKIHPIKNNNELYLYFDNYDNDTIDKLTKKFFSDELSQKEIPHSDFLNFSFNTI